MFWGAGKDVGNGLACPHLTDEATEAQSGEAACLGSQGPLLETSYLSQSLSRFTDSPHAPRRISSAILPRMLGTLGEELPPPWLHCHIMYPPPPPSGPRLPKPSFLHQGAVGGWLMTHPFIN